LSSAASSSAKKKPAPLVRAGKEENSSGKLIDTNEAREDLVKGSWEVEADELQIIEPPLGEGTFAKVYKGMYRNQEVAIKVLKSKVDAKQLDEFRKGICAYMCSRCVECWWTQTLLCVWV
jgi:serine/threonine protein kinase